MARRPLWLWPNLLSLDAPIVALAWFWMFQKAWRIGYYNALLPWLLVLVVWCIYVADRLLDERMATIGSQRKTPRHEFHRRWRIPLGIGLVAGLVTALVFVLYQPTKLWQNASFVLVLVAGYFTMAFVESGGGISYTKNVLAGMAFGFGTSIGLHFYGPDFGDLGVFLRSPEVLSFGVLCVLNITAIDHWEESRKTSDVREKDSYEALLTILLIALATCALFLAAFWADSYRRPFFYGVMISAGSLQLINHYRSNFSLDALRVLGDIAMILPLPVYYVMVNFGER